MATINLREFVDIISKNVNLGEGFDLESIPEIELREGFSDDFHKNYLTPLSAKNNDEVRSHYKGQYLSNVDNRTKAGFLANGGTEEAFNELKSQEPDSMKLIDLILAETAKLGSKQNAPSNNKEFDAYKIQTAKQIEELIGQVNGAEEAKQNALKENNQNWSTRLQSATIKSLLNGFDYNDSIKKEDAIYLAMKNVENSKYLLKLDEDFNQKVYLKTNPENLAVNNGQDMTWDEVLEECSFDYRRKNNQAPAQQQPTRQVSAPITDGTGISPGEGRWTPGHPDYGKR